MDRKLRPSVRNTLAAGAVGAGVSVLKDRSATDTTLQMKDTMVGSGQHLYTPEYVTTGNAVPLGEMAQNAADFGVKAALATVAVHGAIKLGKYVGPKIHEALGKQWRR